VNGLTPVRRLPGLGWRSALWTIFALACVCAGTFALGARPDLAGAIRDPAFLRANALLLLVFVLSARAAFQLSVPGSDRGAAARMLPLGGLLLWGCCIACGRSACALPPAPISIAGLSCAVKLLLLGLAPSLMGFSMLRKAAPLSPGWTGWFALLSPGSLALLGTRWVCAREDPLHLFLWHLLPALAAALLGIYLGRRLLARPRLRA